MKILLTEVNFVNCGKFLSITWDQNDHPESDPGLSISVIYKQVMPFESNIWTTTTTTTNVKEHTEEKFSSLYYFFATLLPFAHKIQSTHTRFISIKINNPLHYCISACLPCVLFLLFFLHNNNIVASRQQTFSLLFFIILT